MPFGVLNKMKRLIFVYFCPRIFSFECKFRQFKLFTLGSNSIKGKKTRQKNKHFFAKQCSLVHSHEKNIFYTILQFFIELIVHPKCKSNYHGHICKIFLLFWSWSIFLMHFLNDFLP